MGTKGSKSMKGGKVQQVKRKGGKTLRIKMDPDGLMHPTEAQKRAVYNDRLDYMAEKQLNKRGYAAFQKDPEGYLKKSDMLRGRATRLRDAVFDRPWYAKGSVPDGYRKAEGAVGVGVNSRDTGWLQTHRLNASLFNKGGDTRPRWIVEVG